jgi:dihydroorotate dehydrogenase (fumarate)
VDLSTRYLGLELENPFVPSASPLSRSLDIARKLEDAGASALVMYSLFEEELRDDQSQPLADQQLGHSEADSFLPVHAHQGDTLDDYLEQLQRIKRALSIPIIASLNGTSLDGWIKVGKQLQQAGADAIELNVYRIAAEQGLTCEDIELCYLTLFKQLRAEVSLPITVKLSPFFSALGNFVKQLEEEGARGVSLFNRFYQPDIDIDSMRIAPTLHLSKPHDSLLAMRWLGILHGRTSLSLAATGGIHTAEDAIKMLLAGADVTHLCSALILHGPKQLSVIRKGVEQWLEESPYDSIEQIKGALSHGQIRDPAAYERASYVSILGGYNMNSNAWD